MQTSEKQISKKYLKHYLGCSAFAMDEHHASVGQIENIDLESDSVCIKTGEESHWFESSIVDASLKSFRQLEVNDILRLVDSLVFKGCGKVDFRDVISVQSIDNNDWISDNDKWKDGVWIRMNDGSVIVIAPNWHIVRVHNGESFVENIGDVIFLLCDMGFEVRRK